MIDKSHKIEYETYAKQLDIWHTTKQGNQSKIDYYRRSDINLRYKFYSVNHNLIQRALNIVILF